MPSALETLVKILKLEQDTGYQDKAVISGLRSFGEHWATDAHAQAKKPEHHALVDELAGLMAAYGDLSTTPERADAIKHMLGRITGRIPPPAGVAARAVEMPLVAPKPEPPAPPARPPRRDDPREFEERRKSREPAPEPVEVRPAERINEPAPELAEADLVSETIDTGSIVDSDEESAEQDLRTPTSSAVSQRMTRPRRRNQRDPQRDLDTLRAIRGSVANVNGIGPKMAEKLEQIGVYTIEDLLYCFPRRYDDYTRMLPLNKVQPNETLTVIGSVRSTTVIKGKRGIDVLNVTIDDGVGTLTASFFGQTYLRSKLERGVQVVFSGKTELFRGQVTMTNPEWELLERDALHTRAIVPVYPLTKGLTSHNMRRFVRTVLEQWTNQLPDYMPESVLERTDLPDLGWALQQIHFPTSMEALEYARRRLTFDELILLQLGVIRNRREWQSQPAERLNVSDEWLNAITVTLPYELTGAQVRAIQAIREDLARNIPMNRLLQGDVGSGKTVVAALSMAIAAANGYQAAIMAPTSILAEQHYTGISRLLGNSPLGESLNIKLLTGATPAQDRADILWGLGEGTVQIVIGTHALLEENVNFQKLGVVVIDEQHRFGVEQRGKLRGKGTNPHVLIMTATPIPRTLALTVHADLDLTVLDEMPPGRTPIDTRILKAKERERAYSFIQSQLEKGRQAFIIYPLVEASENEAFAAVGSAVEEYERLQGEVFSKHQVGLLHGRMSAAEKDEVMAAFNQGETQILVATSVVEVGIDVPNASVMLIEGANRFGLAQLHQFRGRVGRGEHPSYCLLLSDNGEVENPRLQAMESTTDGFELAEIDWKLRGAGELLGTRQSGGRTDLTEYMDPQTVEAAQFEARTIYEEDPDLTLPEHAALREQLRLTFGDRSNADVS